MKLSSRHAGPRLGRLIGLGVAVSIFIMATAVSVHAATSAQDPKAGEATFTSMCAGCHSIGKGTVVGPDLKGISATRDREWLINWIMAPDQMVAKGDPIAKEIVKQYPVQMPNLLLSRTQAEDVLAYIDAQSATAATSATEQPAATAAAGQQATASTAGQQAGATLPPGDPVVGKAYFTGSRRLQNGGPPCMSCHSIAGLGALGGGALGPDLGAALAKYGDAGLASVLASIPFPTMSPIFTTRPLTPEEQSNIKAFLVQGAALQRPARSVLTLSLVAVNGALLLLIIAHLIWRRRLKGTRRPLVQWAALARTRRSKPQDAHTPEGGH